MTRTPDAHPGEIYEDTGVLISGTQAATVEGEIRYTGSRFSLQDSSGEYDPRSGSGISEDQHKVLRQLIHFIDDGPAEGFASLAYRETLPARSPFPTSITWWESSAKLKKIVERLVAWDGSNPTTDQWNMYDTDGSTLLASVIDTVTYSGPFELSRSREIVVV